MTKVDIILLSVIAEKPMHGYEIEQAIKDRHIRKWAAIGTSSVYSGLERLERTGLARSELDTSAGLPARRVFTITEAGRQLLTDGASDLLSNGEYIFLDFNIGLAAFPFLPRRDIIRYARERLRQMETFVADADSQRAQPDGSVPEHAYWLWKHEFDLLQAEVAWLKEFLTALEATEDGGGSNCGSERSDFGFRARSGV